MTELRDLQELVATVRRERGFTMDAVKIFTLLNEVIGEVASELKRTWSANYAEFSEERLKMELADVLFCLIALANQFDINLEEALADKINKDKHRVWKSADIKL